MVQTTAIELDDPRSTRDQILDAGERLFAERGYDGVSMRDIVAGTALRNQASLYHHFRNKQALYEAVLKRGLEQILGLMPERQGSTSAEIDANVDRLIDYLSAHPHLAQLIQRAALDGSPTLQRLLNRLVRPLYNGGRRALSGLDGVWQDDEVPHLAAALYLMTFGYFANASLLQNVVGKDPLGARAVERQRRFLKTAIARLFGIPLEAHRGPSHSESRS
jgi:TetR/AcrR family transcriptional regulator